jgi:GTP cyclohydrolase II
VRNLRLLTNNPDKLRAMEHAGLNVVERVPIVSESTPENEDYLRTKEEELGHLFGDSSSPERGG